VGGVVAAALAFGLVGIQIVDLMASPAPERAPTERAPQADNAGRDRDPIRVSLFGDSLTYQSRGAFLAATASLGVQLATVSTRPGAALCDDRDAIVRDLASKRPDQLVLEYSGNSFTRCMTDAAGALLPIGSASWRDRYRDDLDRIVTMAASTGTEVVWATAPPVEHVGAPPDYPRTIAAVARKVATRSPDVRVADTGAALAGPDGYTPTLPCRPDEAALCHDGRIAVRAADGLHFDCIGTIDGLGGCVGYSAGARRYGDAIAAATIGADGSQVGRTNRGRANAVLSTMTSTNDLGSTSSRYSSSAAR
jgi:hypothetical protein